MLLVIVYDAPVMSSVKYEQGEYFCVGVVWGERSVCEACEVARGRFGGRTLL
jgi:hypothetical protein